MGGCGEVSQAMARVAQRLGVEIRLNEPVTSFDFAGRRVVGARTALSRYEADAVVTNADFAHAMCSLVPNEKRERWTDAKLESKQFSCSTFMLYLGVDGGFEGMPHHSIQISSDYRRNLSEIEDLKVLPTDPSFYVQNACVTDTSLAPEGQSAMYLLAPVPHRTANIDWKREAPGFREMLLRKAEAAGFKGISKAIRYEKMVTPADWESQYAIHKGATFNLAHSLTQMLHFRPRNRFEDVDGMYLVGGGTHPGSGLPVIYEGARITARLMCEDFGLAFPGESGSDLAGGLSQVNPGDRIEEWGAIAAKEPANRWAAGR
jgi:phytoene desaturase